MNRIKDIIQHAKWAIQKRKRGWSDLELWNLETTFAEYIVPRLKQFRDMTIGYPGQLDSIESWKAIIDEMIFGFEFYLKQSDEYEKRVFSKKLVRTKEENDLAMASFETDVQRAQRGRELFGKWFEHLWW